MINSLCFGFLFLKLGSSKYSQARTFEDAKYTGERIIAEHLIVQLFVAGVEHYFYGLEQYLQFLGLVVFL